MTPTPDTREFLLRFKNIDKQFRKAVRRAQKQNGEELVKNIKEGIENPPKTGVKYKQLPNVSSAPGEFPADQSGKLLRSVKKSLGWGINMKVGYKAKHGLFVELGTKKGTRIRGMAPRPALQTAINKPASIRRQRSIYRTELSQYIGK